MRVYKLTSALITMRRVAQFNDAMPRDNVTVMKNQT